jgi:hypothetical protein
MAYTGLKAPASQGKSFFGSFFSKKELLPFHARRADFDTLLRLPA